MTISKKKNASNLKIFYIAILLFSIILLIFLFPLGLTQESKISNIEQSVQISEKNSVINEINKFVFNKNDIIILLETNGENILTNKSSEIISNIIYSIRKNKTTFNVLRNNKIIPTIFTEGRNIVKNYYQYIQKIMIIGNLSSFVVFNGTNFLYNKTSYYYVQTSNVNFSMTASLNDTYNFLENNLKRLSGGFFFINTGKQIIENVSSFLRFESIKNEMILENHSLGLRILDNYITEILPFLLSELISKYISSFFIDLLTHQSLEKKDYWNHTLLSSIVSYWLFRDKSKTAIDYVEEIFAGGNMLRPIELADKNYLSVLTFELTLKGLSPEIITQLLETYTNYAPSKKKLPDTTFFVVPINSANLTLKEYVEIYNMIKEISLKNISNDYKVHCFSGQILELEVGEEYTNEFKRIDHWIWIVMFFVLLLLFRKPLTAIFGLIILILSTISARGFLILIQSLFKIVIYKEGFVIGNSLLLGATINYIVFVISLYKEKYLLPKEFNLLSKKTKQLSLKEKRIFHSFATILITSSVLFVALAPLLLAHSLDSLKTLGLVIVTELPIIVFLIFSYFPLITKLIDWEERKTMIIKDKTNTLKKLKINIHLNKIIPQRKTIEFMLKNTKKVILFTLVVWIVFISLMTIHGFSQSPVDMMGNTGENQQILNELVTGFPDQFFSKFLIVVKFSNELPENVSTKTNEIIDLTELLIRLEKYPNKGIYSPITPMGKLSDLSNNQGNLSLIIKNYVASSLMSLDRTKALIVMILDGDPFSFKIGHLVSQIQKDVDSYSKRSPNILDVSYGGLPLQTSNFTNDVLKDAVLILPLSLIFSFLLLTFWTKTIFIPLRFQYTVISGFIISVFLSQIVSSMCFHSKLNFLVILFSFGLLNAFGLDFDIYFYIHYLKEKGDNVTKIINALNVSYVSIVSAGTIMVLSFFAFLFSPIRFLKQLGLIISISIIIDIFLIRFLLSPVIIGFISQKKEPNNADFDKS